MKKFYCLYNQNNYPFAWSIKESGDDSFANFKTIGDCLNYYLSLKNMGIIWFQKITSKEVSNKNIKDLFDGYIKSKIIDNSLTHYIGTVSSNPSTIKKFKQNWYTLLQIDSVTGKDLLGESLTDRLFNIKNSYILNNEMVEGVHLDSGFKNTNNKEHQENTNNKEHQEKIINNTDLNFKNTKNKSVINNQNFNKNNDKFFLNESIESMQDVNDNFYKINISDFNFNNDFNNNYGNIIKRGNEFMNKKNANYYNNGYNSYNNNYNDMISQGTVEFTAVPNQELNTNLNPLGINTMIFNPYLLQNQDQPMNTIIQPVIRTVYQPVENFNYPTAAISMPVINYPIMESNNNYHYGYNMPTMQMQLPNNISQMQLPNNISQMQLPNNISQMQLPNNASQMQLPNNASQMQLPNNISQMQLPNNASQMELPNNTSEFRFDSNDLQTSEYNNNNNNNIPLNQSNNSFQNQQSTGEIKKNKSAKNKSAKNKSAKNKFAIKNKKLLENIILIFLILGVMIIVIITILISLGIISV